MSVAAARVEIHRPLPGRGARGDFYALLAACLRRAGQEPARGAGRAAPIPPTGDGELSRAWETLILASSAMDERPPAEEYEALFVGMGKSPVSVLCRSLHRRARRPTIRAFACRRISRLRLGIRQDSTEPEDHFAALFEVMRVLVAGGRRARAGAPSPTRSASSKPSSPWARRVLRRHGARREGELLPQGGRVGLAFLAIESESFELD
jgi:TorA maturation chaperone TorD